MLPRGTVLTCTHLGELKQPSLMAVFSDTAGCFSSLNQAYSCQILQACGLTQPLPIFCDAISNLSLHDGAACTLGALQ